MAILVMLIIIVLNIGLLILVMRVGTQGEHHTEFSADQSTAVLTLHERLGIPQPESKSVAVVHEHAKDVETTAEAVAEKVEDIKEEVAEAVEEAKEEVAEAVEDVKDAISGDDDDSDDD